MTEAAKKEASYEDLYTIPENTIGEIINGELLVTPRPARRHVHAASTLGGEIVPPFHFGRSGGPGGWIIYHEPELQLGMHTVVPDLAGWRRERLTAPPDEVGITIPPDWVCEILSPATVRVDKVRKMPIYAHHSVRYLWLVEPLTRTLDVFKLESERWSLLVTFTEDDKVRAEPFQEIEIDLGNLWI